MKKARELAAGDRLLHPYLGDEVEVTKVTTFVAICKIYFKGHGVEGHITVAPDKEMEVIG
jgi:hypothetical protein